MKTSPRTALSAAAIALCASVSNPASAQSTIPALPVGTLSASPSLAAVGSNPTVTWSIGYPASLDSVVNLNPGGSMEPTEPLFVNVQIIGSGVTACEPGAPRYSTDLRFSVNGSPYKQLFYGTQDNVQPGAMLYQKKLSAYDKIDFGGRFVKNGTWSPFFTSRSSNLQVVMLSNGDTPPTTFPLHQSPKLASYLKPYLDASGKVKIGPLSVLVMMELGTSDHSSECFDYQDQVILVSFSTKAFNNGHGNNLDGVDVSNPGGGSGGPNGEIDPSGGVDDEMR